jgi:cold shock CspA family protein
MDKRCQTPFVHKVLEKVDTSSITNNFYNIYVTRKADLKRRKSELYDYRDLEKILELIKEAYELLKSSKEPDQGVFQYMTTLVKSLAYLYYSSEANQFMLKILDEYYSYMRKESDFKKVQDIIISKIEDIEDKNLVERISKYTININDRLESLQENEGLVYYLNKDKSFGFFRNKENFQGVYFKVTQKLRMLQIGDVVKFERLKQTTKGTMTNDILSFYSK